MVAEQKLQHVGDVQGVTRQSPVTRQECRRGVRTANERIVLCALSGRHGKDWHSVCAAERLAGGRSIEYWVGKNKAAKWRVIESTKDVTFGIEKWKIKINLSIYRGKSTCSWIMASAKRPLRRTKMDINILKTTSEGQYYHEHQSNEQTNKGALQSGRGRWRVEGVQRHQRTSLYYWLTWIIWLIWRGT